MPVGICVEKTARRRRYSPMQQSRYKRPQKRVTVLQRDENGGEKQGEKQVCTSRGLEYTGIGVKWETHCPQLHHGNRPDCGPQQRAGSVCGERDWDVRGRKGFSHRLGG